MEPDVGVMYSEGGERGHKPNNAVDLQQLEKARKWILP